MSDLPFDVDGEAGEGSSDSALANRVLVVDDEAVVLDVVSRLLEREPDLNVESVTTAEDALLRLNLSPFELLITDKNLPGLGGVELIEKARQLHPALEAVMITGYASGESVIAALAAGASDYLIKPFDDLRAVRAKIRAVLDKRQERKAARARAQALAREANELLQVGRDAPEQDWQRLEGAFRRYEEAIRKGGAGAVAVLGGDRALELLASTDFDAFRVEKDAPALFEADVAVLETAHPNWRAAADQLAELNRDVILLAHEHSDLADLLEAIALRMELVGFGGKNAGILADRVRVMLGRRAAQKAQQDLSAALSTFRAVLAANPGK